jgi:hypothetical protein
MTPAFTVPKKIFQLVPQVQVEGETAGGGGLGLGPAGGGPRVLEPVDDVGRLQPPLSLPALQPIQGLCVLLSLINT